MPTAILTIDGAPLAVLADRLRAADADMGEPLAAIGASWKSSTKRRFETGTGPDGAAWRPSKRALRVGGQTLVEHGHLKGSITHKVEGNTVEVGSNLVYAAIHQFGGAITTARAKANADAMTGFGQDVAEHRIVMPARPFLGVEPDDYTTWEEILAGFLEEKIGDET